MIQIPSPELIRKYDRPGPRYTSYPTAPEWSDAFKADAFVQHLARADAEDVPPREVEPCQHDDLGAGFEVAQRVVEVVLELEPRVRRAFVSLLRRDVAIAQLRADHADRTQLELPRAHDDGDIRASGVVGSNSSIGFPDGSSSRICLPPRPLTMSLRK